MENGLPFPLDYHLVYVMVIVRRCCMCSLLHVQVHHLRGPITSSGVSRVEAAAELGAAVRGGPDSSTNGP